MTTEDTVERTLELVEHGYRQGYTAALRATLDKLNERIRQTQARAAREQAKDRRRWASKHATELDLLSSLGWEIKGYPNQGISCVWVLEDPVMAGHTAKIHGVPAFGPVRYEVECSCGSKPWLGWSVHVIGAKKLARKHVEDLDKDTWMTMGFDR